MLENEEFQGRYVQVPIEFFARLVTAAANHAARISRYVDTSTLDGCMAAIADWLDDLEQARTMPTPHAEAGDLLVKLKRAEFWTFTMHGWRELAPIELLKVSDVENAVDRGGEFTSRQVPTDEPHAVAYETRYRPSGAAEPERDFLVGPTETVRTGWDIIHEATKAEGRRIGEAVALANELRERFARRHADAELEGGVVLALADWLSHRNEERDA